MAFFTLTSYMKVLHMLHHLLTQYCQCKSQYDLSNILHHTGQVKSSQSASFAGIPPPAYTPSSYASTAPAASPNALQDVQRQLQEAAQSLGLIVNSLPQGPQAFYQATESAAQASQQSVQNAPQQILQLQQQATAGTHAFQQQPQQPNTALGFGISCAAPPNMRMMSPAGAGATAEARPAVPASPAAALEKTPMADQELEKTSAFHSLHAHEPTQPQPAAAPSGMPAPVHDPQRPTSVAEDEVDTVILRTDEADR